MFIDVTVTIISALSLLAIAYHHFGYPRLLRALTSGRRAAAAQDPPDADTASELLPKVTLIVPAYNEHRVIKAKMRNLLALDYPSDRLRIVIAVDGCTDATESIVRNFVAEAHSLFNVEIVVTSANVGKLATLNREIARTDSEVVALTDASAALLRNALRRGAAHFLDAGVGVVCASYRLTRTKREAERAYWNYQTDVKRNEALLAAPMGAHGAFYLFRRSAWEPLPSTTINDDFVLPMAIVAKGYRALYDTTIVASELELTTPEQEFSRRIRIGAGNVQQLKWFAKFASPRFGWLAFVFLSGKGLRPLMPGCSIIAGLAITFLAYRGYALFQAAFLLGLIATAVAAFAATHRKKNLPPVVSSLGYLFEGHAASMIGAIRFMRNPERIVWSQKTGENADFIPASVRIGKRVFDLACGAATIALFTFLFVPIALAIKLESPGPIFYRQLRVGRVLRSSTEIFYLFKFRTMHRNAETNCGAVWATKSDPRITTVGRFLRLTRLDELPQVFNVIKGEMSFVGPRPERPKFVGELYDRIPFYVERTYNVLPGITGLAQINQGYDESIDDVRRKILYDHAYAARLASFGSWLRTDFGIMFGTIRVMMLRRGQ